MSQRGRYVVVLLFAGLFLSHCASPLQEVMNSPLHDAIEKNKTFDPYTFVDEELLERENITSAESAKDIKFELPTIRGGIKRAVERHMKYPKSARRAGIQGTVMSKVYVDKDGTIAGVIIESSPNETFKRQAIETFFRIGSFDTPGLANGIPTLTVMKIPVTFRLN